MIAEAAGCGTNVIKTSVPISARGEGSKRAEGDLIFCGGSSG